MKAKRQKAEIAACLFLLPFLSRFSLVAVHLHREGKCFHASEEGPPYFFREAWLECVFLVKRDFLFTRDSWLVIPQTTHSKKEKNEMKKIDEKVDCGLKNKKKWIKLYTSFQILKHH